MKAPKLRDECYNCHMLFGSPFNPCCYRRMNPSVRDDGKCVGYTPIIKEKNDGNDGSVDISKTLKEKENKE